MKIKILIILFCISTISSVRSQESEDAENTPVEDEQNAASKAMDATATQWSFQLAYQTMPDYYSDDVNGSPRKQGLDNYVQLRVARSG